MPLVLKVIFLKGVLSEKNIRRLEEKKKRQKGKSAIKRNNLEGVYTLLSGNKLKQIFELLFL